MSSSSTSTAAELPRRIALATALGRDIPNEQWSSLSAFESSQLTGHLSPYGPAVVFRARPTPIYNCHGLVFAARRTAIHETAAIRDILADDGYREVLPSEVLPGDILLYVSPDGDIEHSAVVVTPPTQSALGMPIVVSKWGRGAEVVHPANRCPYALAGSTYYRVQR